MIYDFSGWATKNDILCTDGRIIKKDAFAECDGLQVPLVYMHNHNSIDNVIGHCVLENRDEGVYCYGKLNEGTDGGRQALSLIKGGDLNSLSIFANNLKQKGREVIHGVIKEVSLVLAGANRGAKIDNILAHGEDAEDSEGLSGIQIYAGEENPIIHSDAEEEYEDEMFNESNNDSEEDTLQHEDDDDEDFDLEGEIDGMTPNQIKAMKIMMGIVADEAEKAHQNGSSENVEHSSVDTENFETIAHEDSSTEETTQEEESNDSNEESNSEEESVNSEGDEYDDDDSDDDSDETLNHSNEEGENEMNEIRHDNLFEGNGQQNGTTYSAAEMCSAIMDDAVKYGSLKDSVMAHAQAYGIENIEYLFPDAKNYTEKPGFIKRRTEWVNVVLNGVHQSPFSRVKSIFADITEDEARAKGYIKGNRKMEEVFSLLKRETTPTTVYKKQAIDHDDVDDITDFDIVVYIKEEMRIMYDEEVARAILVGDGRNPLSPDKIKEANIRPIWKDDDLFTVKRAIAVTTATTDQNRAKMLIKNIIKSRKLYKGSGNPTLFITEDLLSDMLLIEDTTGRLIYDSLDKLKNVLRVNSIVEVPIFDGLYRIDGADTKYLAAILVNLNDYVVGRNKNKGMQFFEDFNIDFNKQVYLYESRFSGALVTPFSAIVYEFVYNLTIDVQAEDPTTTVLGKLVNDLQRDVYVNDNSIQGIVNYTTNFTEFSSDPELQQGYYLALKFEASDGATTTIQTIGGVDDSRVTPLDSDMNAVIYVKSNREKLKVTTELNGDTITKILSFSGLRMIQ